MYTHAHTHVHTLTNTHTHTHTWTDYEDSRHGQGSEYEDENGVVQADQMGAFPYQQGDVEGVTYSQVCFLVCGCVCVGVCVCVCVYVCV